MIEVVHSRVLHVLEGRSITGANSNREPEVSLEEVTIQYVVVCYREKELEESVR